MRLRWGAKAGWQVRSKGCAVRRLQLCYIYHKSHVLQDGALATSTLASSRSASSGRSSTSAASSSGS